MAEISIQGGRIEMIKKALIILCVLMCVSCGGQANPDPEKPTVSTDCSKFVPEGFTLETQLEGCGVIMATAKKGDGLCPRILMVIKDGQLKGMTKEIKCKSIVFGSEELVCAQIAPDVRGIPVEFEVGGQGMEDTFIKVIDVNTFRDIPVKLGAGLVPKDFNDINGDGMYELIVIDNRWFGLKIFQNKTIPFTHKIAVCKDGKFVDETSRFTSYLDAGAKAWSKIMNEAPNELETANAAVILALIYKDQGKPEEGINLINLIISKAESKDLVDSLVYFKQEYVSKKDPDWFYPARKPAWEPLGWQQTKIP
jgi:hypothetical protein